MGPQAGAGGGDKAPLEHFRAVVKGWREDELAAEAAYRICACLYYDGHASEADGELQAFLKWAPDGTWRNAAAALMVAEKATLAFSQLQDVVNAIVTGG